MSTKTNITIEQHTTFSNTLLVLGDWSNMASANAFMRPYYTSNVVAVFAVTVNVEANLVTLSLTANQTGNVWYGRYYYDCVITDNSGNITRVLEGIATVTAAVTFSGNN